MSDALYLPCSLLAMRAHLLPYKSWSSKSLVSSCWVHS